VKTHGTCLRGEYLEVELKRVQEIFGEFFPRLPIHFEQHAGPQPLIGLTNILPFKSDVVTLTLSPRPSGARGTPRTGRSGLSCVQPWVHR
jgi:hypothetical protein